MVMYKLPIDRLMERIKVIDSCWIYQGAITGEGYGCISVNDKIRSTHKVSYEYFKGPVPEGLCIDPSLWGESLL